VKVLEPLLVVGLESSCGLQGLPGASIPMGQGGHVPPIFMKGDVHGNVLQYLGVYFYSNSNNCRLLYFKAKICVVSQKNL